MKPKEERFKKIVKWKESWFYYAAFNFCIGIFLFISNLKTNSTVVYFLATTIMFFAMMVMYCEGENLRQVYWVKIE